MRQVDEWTKLKADCRSVRPLPLYVVMICGEMPRYAGSPAIQKSSDNIPTSRACHRELHLNAVLSWVAPAQTVPVDSMG